MRLTPEKEFDAILKAARLNNASDIHLIAGLPPSFRVSGEIIIADWEPLSRETLRTITKSLLSSISKQDDDFRIKQFYLCFKKWFTCLYFTFQGIAILWWTAFDRVYDCIVVA